MKKVIIFILILSIILCIPLHANPGDKDDPIIVLSYLNERIKQIISQFKLESIETVNNDLIELKNAYKENKLDIENLKDKSQSSTQTTNNLEIVSLTEGQKLIAGAGSEIILRSGKATAIAAENSGLSDITQGIDIKQNENIQKNHMIIIPRDDGRGILCVESAILMIRGTYTIEQ